VLKPSSFEKNLQCSVLADTHESRSFTLKRKGTTDESDSDLEQTIIENRSPVCKVLFSGPAKDLTSNKRCKADVPVSTMLLGNKKINFNLKVRDGNAFLHSSRNNEVTENMQMSSNEDDHERMEVLANEKNSESEKICQTLKDFPSANGTSSYVKATHKPIMITREQYNKKKEDVPKPKTIMILLTQDQLKFAHSGINIGAYVMEKTQARLEVSSGAANGYTLINHKLFLYPGTNDDHDKIFKNKVWALGHNEMFSLENKGNFLILRGISVEEIETHSQIKEDLQRIGVKCWKCHL
jgi:hypothetical protein